MANLIAHGMIALNQFYVLIVVHIILMGDVTSKMKTVMYVRNIINRDIYIAPSQRNRSHKE